ncbi:hypothetical protein EVAR_12842_1 [Eumeta japonica]|uniref:Uncharacterized protein n=1 Tax=Eumeta variegata TaxID=151549 RepID=A0A4C1UB55_EUMVA|nr:hypothetical protein EVAR_12842_1 [Eumeta japonica]
MEFCLVVVSASEKISDRKSYFLIENKAEIGVEIGNEIKIENTTQSRIMFKREYEHDVKGTREPSPRPYNAVVLKRDRRHAAGAGACWRRTRPPPPAVRRRSFTFRGRKPNKPTVRFIRNVSVCASKCGLVVTTAVLRATAAPGRPNAVTRVGRKFQLSRVTLCCNAMRNFSQSTTLRLGVTLKSVTLGNVTMSHRTEPYETSALQEHAPHYPIITLYGCTTDFLLLSTHKNTKRHQPYYDTQFAVCDPAGTLRRNAFDGEGRLIRKVLTGPD